ncbi:MAG: V-type ATP synthase subunit C [Lentisphaerae bacterium ADurb.BinA184]|nr:MAG: V-type ATP synthase subunit C [Lentisphaerae bacterium ADurb.BinA184]
MAIQSANTGTDFLFPKLHGRWAEAWTGERLGSLLSGGMQALGRALAPWGVSVQHRARVQKELTEHLIAELGAVRGLLDAAASIFYGAFIHRYFLANLKTLLRRRYQESGETDVEYLLVQSPQLPALPVEVMVSARTVHQFYRLIPPLPQHDRLLPILVELDDSHDFLVAEARIDALYYEWFLEAAAGVRRPARATALDLVQTEIDVLNLIMALRNVVIYRLPEASMERLFIAGGRLLPAPAAAGLADARTVNGLLAGVPGEYAQALSAVGPRDLYRMDNALWQLAFRRAERAFRDFGRPAASVASFPYLKQAEHLNLNRLFEGLYLKLDPAVTRTMLVGV